MLHPFAFHLLVILNISLFSVDSLTPINQSLPYLGQEINILHYYRFACKCKPLGDLISCALVTLISPFSLQGI